MSFVIPWSRTPNPDERGGALDEISAGKPGGMRARNALSVERTPPGSGNRGSQKADHQHE